MKRMIKNILLLAVISMGLSSCTLWQEEWKECTPLPDVETPISPDPWEPEENIII